MMVTTVGEWGQGAAGEARCGGDASAAAGPVQTIGQRVGSLEKLDGFIPMYLDAKTGRVYLEIAKFDMQFLQELHIANGAGTNGINLGAIGRPYVVHFSRVGPKVMLTAENFAWRTSSTEAAEKRAVNEGFPESVLAGFTVAAEDAPNHVLVDATELFLRDAEGLADRLGAGYRLDLTRSAIMPANTKNFPLNTEVETMLRSRTKADAGLRRRGRAGAVRLGWVRWLRMKEALRCERGSR